MTTSWFSVESLPFGSLLTPTIPLLASSLVISVMGILCASVARVVVNSLGGEFICTAIDGLIAVDLGGPSRFHPTILSRPLGLASLIDPAISWSSLWSAVKGWSDPLASEILLGDLDVTEDLGPLCSTLLEGLDLSLISIDCTSTGATTACWPLTTLHDNAWLIPDPRDFLSVSTLLALALATVLSLPVFVSAGAAKSGVSAGEFDVDIQ